MQRSGPIRVSLAVFPEADPSIFYGVYDTLWASGRWTRPAGESLSNAPLFEPRLVAAAAGPVTLVTGVSVIAQDAVDDVAETDIVFVPNVVIESASGLRGLDRKLLDWLRRMHARGAHVYSACGGALVLAEAGLLDGHEATTHWCYVDLFRAAYPAVRLRPERLLVQAGPGQRIVCSGGASSWQDLVLYIVAKQVGTDEALRLSRLFLYQWHSESQLPYATMVCNVTHSDAAIREQQEWIAHHYERPQIVAEVTRRSGLPARSFSRRFKAATGYAPLAYVQALRVEEAKQMLERGPMPVEDVAAAVGYRDPASFHRLFRRLTSMTPAEYRRKFRMPAFFEGP